MQALTLVYNPDESAILRLVLQRVGISARLTTDLDQAFNEWPDQAIELIVLALKKDIPLASIRQLRANAAVPMIIICDPIDEDLQIQLLDSGIDLIVFRPYSARLLIAQTRALLRRLAGVPFFTLPSITRGDLILDPANRMAQIKQNQPVRLTQLEFRLLYTLMMNPDQVFPAETLVEHVWGYSGRGDRDLVRGLIRRLRSKVEPNPKSPQYIQTVPRVGYVFKYQS